MKNKILLMLVLSLFVIGILSFYKNQEENYKYTDIKPEVSKKLSSPWEVVLPSIIGKQPNFTSSQPPGPTGPTGHTGPTGPTGPTTPCECCTNCNPQCSLIMGCCDTKYDQCLENDYNYVDDYQPLIPPLLPPSTYESSLRMLCDL